LPDVSGTCHDSVMQMTARLSAMFRRSRKGTRHLALASVALLMSQCAPQQCAPAPAPSSHFGTLPPGSALPSSADCARRVRPAAEVRPGNASANATRGYTYTPSYSFAAAQLRRVDGAFSGTTDQIIQWAACKWGIDENIVRAQIAKESYWNQGNLGDWWNYPANQCPPGHGLGADGRAGQCPQSIGMGQVRYSTGDGAFPGVERSSAMNLDVTYAIWRACYEGKETWLNDVERGRQYAKGDAWGCVGRWFAGRWYTQPANDYVAAVKDYLNRRIWTDPGFINWRP
jgi:autotransporter family porin